MSEAEKKGTVRRRGVSLAEALLASTILAVVGATATYPFVAGTQQVTESAKTEEAVALGQALMEEILARPFFEEGSTTPSPGPDAGETDRSLYKSIDDFHGVSESDKVLRNFKNDDAADSSNDGYWRTASVVYVSFPNQSPGDANAFARITVDVFYKDTLQVRLVRIAAREN